MNSDQWINQITGIYQDFGAILSPEKIDLLLSKVSSNVTDAQKGIVAEFLSVINRDFFKRATVGETYGALDRVNEQMGISLGDNYGLQSGPFINMAKTYWTFKFEVQDLFPESHELVLNLLLLEIETNIAAVFFPTPGPMSISVEKRRDEQRRILKESAPEINAEQFLSESPILSTPKRGGCFGILLAIASLALSGAVGVFLLVKF